MIRIHSDFTGGNIRILQQNGDEYILQNDLRTTADDWFYWAFCVEGAAGETLRFVLRDTRIGHFGPAVSHDLRGWTWLGGYTGDGCFTYTFGAKEDKVYFAHSLLYHPDRFADFAAARGLSLGELCKSGKGRSVPSLSVGEGSTRIMLAARHHACESPGSFVLEGLLDSLIADPIPDTCLFVAPFVDYDGVVDGDQGKGRWPYDHNRDYAPEKPSIYPECAAIRREAEKGCHYAFDFHAPYHKNGGNDKVFIVRRNIEKESRLVRFAELFEESITPDSLPYVKENDYPTEYGWNYGAAQYAHLLTQRPENEMAFTLETCYFGDPSRPATEESLLALGRCYAAALRRYIQEQRAGLIPDMEARTVSLREVDGTNFDECRGLKRAGKRFVGQPDAVLAEGYLYRDTSRVFAINYGERVIGMVIARVDPAEGKPYSFTDFFIADPWLNRGFGSAAVDVLLELFRSLGKSDRVEIQVHETNSAAIHVYQKAGFAETGRAAWNKTFIVMKREL